MLRSLDLTRRAWWPRVAAWLTRRWVNRLAVGGPVLAIFVTDLFTDWAIAVAVLYVVPILLSLRLLSALRVRQLSAACVVLTLLGSPLARFGSTEAGVVNLGIGVTAIVTTAYLGLRTLALEAASHEARAQLLRLSRIGNLGELTASIAHEVNQPLAALSSSAGAARRWLAADPPDLARARASLERVARDATRASEVVAGVRRLASRRVPSPELLRLDAVIEEGVALARAELEQQRIRLHLAVDHGLPAVRADRVQLLQVLLNLLLNAIESVAAVGNARREVSVTARAVGQHAVLRVADSGPGLSTEAEQHLWEPFWTSKQGGTGLGLTMGRAIAEAHGGTLRCEAPAGGGAVFELRLPAGGG